MTSKIRGWHFIKYLGNLTFSIVLLLIISFISILGTIIEQDRSREYYQEKYPIKINEFLNFNWQLIQTYKLDQIYTSWFFLFLMLIFSLSLIICTFSTQLPSLKNARQWKFKKRISAKRLLYAQSYKEFSSFSPIIFYLNRMEYYIFYQKNYIYSYKGLQGKLGPIFVHLSILLLLFGSITSLLTSFSIQEMVPSGEMFNLQNIVKSGYLSSIPNNIDGTVHYFDIEYYPNKSIKQFYSSLLLINNNNQRIKEQVIAVNQPLYFEGLTIYQTDWQINGIRLEINNQENIQIPLRKFNNSDQVYWFATLEYNSNYNYSFILSNVDGNILCYNKHGELLHALQLKQNNIIDYIPVKITNVLMSTGLQIKQDAGVNIIYASFLCLMLSIVASYLSYSQIWLTSENAIVTISGTTNRAEINFEEDIYKLKKFLI
jgi:cytochrome c biogenesis protein